MRLQRILIILILSEIVLVGVSIVIGFALAADSDESVRAPNTLLSALWDSVIVATVVAWIGLLNLVRAARHLYVASWAGYFVFILLGGQTPNTAIGSVAQLLTALTSGTIVGLVYFSELRTKFRTLSEAVREARQGAA